MTTPHQDHSAPHGLTRREFHRLSTAAVGGLLGGALVAVESGCNSFTDVEVFVVQPHACRGLNQCKTEKNACAGQGSCTTYAAHSCSRKNECKGQGGCGAKPGENECRGKGQCGMPMPDHAWKLARENFEKRMQAAGKSFGPAPAAKK